MSAPNDTHANRFTDTVAPTVDVPPVVVDEVAARLEAAGVEPTDAAIRGRVFDQVEVSPELHADGRPVAAAVRDQLEGGK